MSTAEFTLFGSGFAGLGKDLAVSAFPLYVPV
jgi:hypothetical protein